MVGSTGNTPGPLIGTGHAADVFDIGGGRVLRRNRNGMSTEHEATVMLHVHAEGFPVPMVYDFDGGDLVMERIDGATMLDSFPRRPWMLNRWGQILADLHNRLEQLALPHLELPTPFGPGDTLVHGDLHPDNIMLSAKGPVVIDWPNAAKGPPGMDVAHTWLLMATSELDTGRFARPLQSLARSHFISRFLAAADEPRPQELLPLAAKHRLQDRTLRPAEAEAIHALIAENGP